MGTWDGKGYFTLKQVRDCKSKPQSYQKGTEEYWRHCRLIGRNNDNRNNKMRFYENGDGTQKGLGGWVGTGGGASPSASRLSLL